jgi:ABC-type transport system involved in multi-copper enzyme maturation permease subunit
MIASLGAELLKLRKRPSTWVLALIWPATIILFNYTLAYALLSNAPPPVVPEGTPKAQREQLREQQEEFQQEQLEFLYPENLVSNLTPGFPNLGAPIALILGALAVGSEYGWSTFKTVLTQRPGRLALFFGKLLALGIVLALLVVMTFSAAAASGYVIAGLEGAPAGFPAAGALVRALGAGGLILAVWATLGVILATLLRSTALSIGIGLVYSLVLETIIFNLPIQNKAFLGAREFFPGQNSNFLANSFSTQAPGGFAPPEPPVDAPQAAFVLLAYAAAFVALAAFVFSRRDVN